MRDSYLVELEMREEIARKMTQDIFLTEEEMIEWENWLDESFNEFQYETEPQGV